MALVALQGLTKRYGASTAVDDVTLTIDDGRITCLLGPSGCGKTTTLRLIAGFISPDGGEIRVGGKQVSSPARTLAPEQRNMSMIFQSYALWPHLTISENVAYGLKLRRLHNGEIKKRVDAILAVTHLEKFVDRYPSELSGGQQQRVALARALVVDPETLLLDEPLSNLDANLREEMRFEIRRLHDKFKYTTIYVTHDQAEAMTTADRIVVMNQGKIEQAGSPEDIYQRPLSEFVARFIGGTNILRGRNLGSDAIAGDGFTLRCGQGMLSAAEETAVSVRHHDIRLDLSKPAGDSVNTIAGTVVRQIYLGAHRDYLVALPGDVQVRVATPTHIEAAVGSHVWLHFPPECCRALAH
jgi:iron(III) transport system ATP-binding protein